MRKECLTLGVNLNNVIRKEVCKVASHHYALKRRNLKQLSVNSSHAHIRITTKVPWHVPETSTIKYPSEAACTNRLQPIKHSASKQLSAILGVWRMYKFFKHLCFNLTSPHCILHASCITEINNCSILSSNLYRFFLY